MNVKYINGYAVKIDGTHFEINAPHGGDVIKSGTCEPDSTPRQVFDSVFERNQNDGKVFNNVTLFFISDGIGFGITDIFAKTAALDINEYSLSQEGYRLLLKPLRAKYDRYAEWSDRPIIIAVNGRYDLPESVLYNVEETETTITRRGKYSTHSPENLVAIADHLTKNHIPYFYL